MTHDVIVIGGSAGALDALLTWLPALPAGVDAPIVVAIHQGPHKSLIPGLLAQACDRTVHDIEDKEPLMRGAIYVAPPNYHVLVERDRSLSLSVDDPVMFSRPSIDVLFESAADAFGAGVIGIVLSGANEDGAAGLARIASAGGVAIVQAPDTAVHDTMPRAALSRAGASAHSLAITELGSYLAGLECVPRKGDVS